MTIGHDPGELAAHALGLLDPREAAAVQAHLAHCPDCRREWQELRETSALLDDVPPEMFLDGPPDSDLVLQRALWQVRGESRSRTTRRRVGLAVAAVVTGAALVGGAAWAGANLAPDQAVVAADAVTVEGRAGQVQLAATLTPAKGWVRVSAAVSGLPAGERCEIVLTGRDGTELVAGGWVTGSDPNGATVDGSAALDPAQVAAVTIRNEAGREFISVPV
jgi:anti-sigma factor RsiW